MAQQNSQARLPVAEFDSLREMLGLSVEEMAHKIGISVATPVDA
ncbi:MAG: helix-turn-helix transcriptional regulator [Lentimonas sp.]